jgi:hypothetical protein
LVAKSIFTGWVQTLVEEAARIGALFTVAKEAFYIDLDDVYLAVLCKTLI